MEFRMKIKNQVENPGGKWAENLGNVVFFDTKFFFINLRE